MRSLFLCHVYYESEIIDYTKFCKLPTYLEYIGNYNIILIYGCNQSEQAN